MTGDVDTNAGHIKRVAGAQRTLQRLYGRWTVPVRQGWSHLVNIVRKLPLRDGPRSLMMRLRGTPQARELVGKNAYPSLFGPLLREMTFRRRFPTARRQPSGARVNPSADLESSNLAAENGRVAVAVIIHAPVVHAGCQVCSTGLAREQPLEGTQTLCPHLHIPAATVTAAMVWGTAVLMPLTDT